MKKIFMTTWVIALVAIGLFTTSATGYAVQELLSNGEISIVEDEVIIRVDPDFDGVLSEELRALKVVSLKEIFNIGDTVMFLVETDGPVDGIIASLEELPYVQYAEYNQEGDFLASEVESAKNYEIIENEIIIRVNPDFDGILSEELKALKVESLKEIFNIGDTVMFLVETDGAVDGIIASLEELPYVQYAEYNQEGDFLASEVESAKSYEIIENEIIIRVNPDFDGILSEELKALKVESLKEIFNIGDTVMYLVETDGAVDGIIASLEELPFVQYAEYNQQGDFLDATSQAETETVGNMEKSSTLNQEETQTSNGVRDKVFVFVVLSLIICIGLGLYVKRRTLK